MQHNKLGTLTEPSIGNNFKKNNLFLQSIAGKSKNCSERAQNLNEVRTQRWKQSTEGSPLLDGVAKTGENGL